MIEFLTFSTVKGLAEIENNLAFVNEEGIANFINIKKDAGNLNYDLNNSFNFYKNYPNFFSELGNDFKTIELEIFLKMIKLIKPFWVSEVRNGRSALMEILREDPSTIDTIQIFEELDLLNSGNDQSSKWWTYLEFYFKSEDSVNKRELGLAGEILSRRFEEKYMYDNDVDGEVQNMAVDNPSAGFDIISYRLNSKNEIQKIYIESKLNSQSKRCFYLSRNEYNKCIDLSEFYFVYLWLVDEKSAKKIISGDEDLILDLIDKGPEVLGHKKIEENTPKDRGGSEWKEAFISLN
tara:strand:- start:165 stop:1043 length:879 start_codon:yes stop_codon:yes gene_type:complete